MPATPHNDIEKPVHVSTIYIEREISDVWHALTSADFTEKYWHQTKITSRWHQGDDVTFVNPDGTTAVAGTVLQVRQPVLLQYTWHVHYNPEAKAEAPTRVTFELEDVDGATKLTVIHDMFPPSSVVFEPINEGWIKILCSLKTLLETGSAMKIS